MESHLQLKRVSQAIWETLSRKGLPGLLTAWLILAGTFGAIDAQLHRMHIPGDSAFGTADLTPFLRKPEIETVVATWDRWELEWTSQADPATSGTETDSERIVTQRTPDGYLRMHANIDFLFAAISALLLWRLVIRAFPERGSSRRRLFAAAIWSYLIVDWLENFLLLAIADGHTPEPILLGFLTNLKWLLLIVTIVTAVVAAPPIPRGAVPRVARVVVALRIQLITAAMVVALAVIPGDLRLQVQDLFLRAGNEDNGWILPILLSTALALCMWLTGRVLTAQALRTPAPPAATPRRWILWAIVGGGIALLGWRLTDARGFLVPIGLAIFVLAGLSLTSKELTLQVDKNALLQARDLVLARRVLLSTIGALSVTAGLVMSRNVVALYLDLPPWWQLPVVVAVFSVLVQILFTMGCRASLRPDTTWKQFGLLTCLLVAVGSLAVIGATDPIRIGWAVGSLSIYLLGCISFLVVGTAVAMTSTRLPARGALERLGFRRVPLGLILLLPVVFGSPLDQASPYHDARVISASTASNVDNGLSEVGIDDVRHSRASDGVDEHRVVTLDDAARDWITQLDDDQSGEVPMIFVATAGGGIKAAYWTNVVLGCLQDPAFDFRLIDVECSEDDAAQSLDRRLLFMASGISGGSVGLAFDQARFGPSGEARLSTFDLMATALTEDFVAPVLAALFWRDVPNSVLRFQRVPDRAAVLEEAWSAALGNFGDAMDQGFFATFLEQGADDRPRVRTFPILSFNAGSIEDRCRLTVTPANITGRDALDCLGLDPSSAAIVSRTKLASAFICIDEDLRMSTAALLSARFPFVSPYGQLHSCEKLGPSTFVTDGGLVEGSGAGPLPAVLAEVMNVIQLHNEKGPACISPRLIIIDHSYYLPTRRHFAAPGQLIAPRVFTSNDSTAYAASQQEAMAAFRQAADELNCGDRGDPVVAEFRLTSTPGIHAPLGWTLSEITRSEMQAQVALKPFIGGFDIVQSWLDLG